MADANQENEKGMYLIRKIMLLMMLFAQQSYAGGWLAIPGSFIYLSMGLQTMLNNQPRPVGPPIPIEREIVRVRDDRPKKAKHSIKPNKKRFQKIQRFPKNLKHPIKQPRSGF
jgi:hypothetical protein